MLKEGSRWNLEAPCATVLKAEVCVCVWVGAFTAPPRPPAPWSQDWAASGHAVAWKADGLHQLNFAVKAACVGELKVSVRKRWSV